jgi:NAD(P)-dependent dehydrogenase (short-subunit alcohol dehydrogenase family)
VDFAGKVVLVTGGSRGIGRSIASHFAEAGAKVALHYHRDQSAAKGTLSSLAGSSHQLFQADLGDGSAARILVESVIAQMGQIDILVNNAGIFEEHRLADVSYQEWLEIWDRTLAVNLLGPANITYWVAHHMIGRGGGRIVNVSSRGAFRGEPHAPAYGASKAGLNAMSQSLAQALAPHGIFVYVVAPGWVETDMAAESLASPTGEDIRAQSPLGRVARPEEVARIVLFLASEGTDYLTGCIVDVNGASYLRT